MKQRRPPPTTTGNEQGSKKNQLFPQPYSSNLDEVKAAEGDAHAAGGANSEGEGLRHPEPRQQVAEYGRGQEDHQLEDAKHETVLRGRGSLYTKWTKYSIVDVQKIPQMRTRNTRSVIQENPGVPVIRYLI
jgi:hypothetical protein